MTGSQAAGAERRWFLGTAIRILVSATEGSDEVCVVEHQLPEGDTPPVHIHRNEDEILLVLEGRLRLEVDGRTTYLERGQAALAPKGVPHSFRVESSGARLISITRGRDFETMLLAASHPSSAPGLPPRAAPSPEAIAALTESCGRNHIEIVGPGLAPGRDVCRWYS